MAKILILDDDAVSLLLMQHILHEAGHEVFPLMRATKVSDALVAVRPDLVITDIMMPGISGGAVYENIRSEMGPFLPVIISSSTCLHVKGTKDDPLLEYCPKPITRELILETVRVLLDKASTLRSADEVEGRSTDSNQP